MISVCLATHNGEKYIRQQLDSILCQMGDDDEVIISDDGSTDGTISVIESLHDGRIVILNYKQPYVSKYPHEYVCRNFQNALMRAKGDYIFLSDQDDEWMPDKVKTCMEALKTNDVVLHEFMHIDENDNVVSPIHYNGTFRPKNYFLRVGKHYGCAMAFRRSVLDYALPFPQHLLLHDYWIGILAETLGSFVFLDKPLLRYRVHLENTSGNHNSLIHKLSYRVKTFLYLMQRVVRYKLGIHHYLNNYAVDE